MAEYLRCPKCNNAFWLIEKRSANRGDKPTEVKCAFCGYDTNV